MDSKPRLKPRRLRPGATLGVIAPAGPGNQEQTAAGIAWLEQAGFRIKPGTTVSQELGYLAGPDALRAADLQAMFADPAVDGIICLRGGYGTMRLLELLDYDLIRQNPKVFVGYSDITALHTSIGQRAGLITFHGPMVASDMGKELPLYTWDYFLQAVTAPAPLGLIANPPLAPDPAFIVPGTAAGPLTGGNLSLLAATLGTPYEIDTAGKILCLEEVGEAPYRIDRLLTQLSLAGKLQAAAGIVFDVCADCETEAKPPSFTIAEVLAERLGSLGKPVLINLHFGHTADKATLPLGVNATLRPEDGGLVITEAATTA
ncbi:S66 peptidase family protein [Sporomusa termitida]|uniref:Putative murein peptide carboxypeptidase n=1 Tax=Sporomusa termitida TaxID=2377 RepID=A0A517DYG1_9FIRM|nr:LD-carboxypeptidase [Sporomusa termitida]QDR82399.1 putative murein peptide carboxypeptidase [Sporomusa termitida]